MSNTPYLDSLRRARRNALDAVNESPNETVKTVTLDAWVQINAGVEALEKFEMEHYKVTAQTLQEQERARLNGPYSHKDLCK